MIERHPNSDAFKLQPWMCPACGALTNAAAQIPGVDQDDSPPDPGDFSLCFKCCAILRFTDALTLRVTTLAEIHELRDQHPAHYQMIRDQQLKLLAFNLRSNIRPPGGPPTI